MKYVTTASGVGGGGRGRRKDDTTHTLCSTEGGGRERDAGRSHNLYTLQNIAGTVRYV